MNDFLNFLSGGFHLSKLVYWNFFRLYGIGICQRKKRRWM